MNLEEKMKQDLCRELIIPDVVDEKLNKVYQQIMEGRPQEKQHTKQINTEQTIIKQRIPIRANAANMNTSQASAKTAHVRQKNRRIAAWTAVAAAALIIMTAGGLLFCQPALARDLPIIGGLFQKIQDTNRRINPKDKTVYKQIEKYSKNTADPGNNTDGSFTESDGDTDTSSAESKGNANESGAKPGTIADDSGIEVRVSDVYFDGYDLYYTFSIRTEDEELSGSEFLTPLNFIEGDLLPFFASAFLNGTEVTSVFLQPRKSEDSSFVQLVRISMDSAGLTPTDTLDVKLAFNAVGGTRLEDIGTYEGAYQEAMGHKTIRGNWKLAFQASADPSGSRSLTSPSENQGFSVTKAIATPSNLHLTILIPFGWNTDALVPQIFDSSGKIVDWEHISYAADGTTGQPLLEITANATEASRFVVKIVDKTTSTDDMPNVIAEIPFELQ